MSHSSANSSPSSTNSDLDDPVYTANNNTLAASLAGLPLHSSTNTNLKPAHNLGAIGPPSRRVPSAGGATVQSGQLKDFLDLATTQKSQSADVALKLEQKRIEHERQRELQKKAFEEQMRKLQEQQEKEELELIAASDPSSTTTVAATSNTVPAPSPSGGVPVRSRSGNDLVSFASVTSSSPSNANNSNTKSSSTMSSSKIASNFKSMPGSRRHSGEVSSQDAALVNGGGVRRKGREGEPMLNSFLFDDELEADLQNSAWGGKYLQMNTDDDKFPILLKSNGQLSASSAALDLAPLSQTPSHASRVFSSSTGPSAGPHSAKPTTGGAQGAGASGVSEWPQFTSASTILRPTSAAGSTVAPSNHNSNGQHHSNAGAAPTSTSNGGSPIGTPGVGGGERVRSLTSEEGAQVAPASGAGTSTTTPPGSAGLPPPPHSSSGTPGAASGTGTGARMLSLSGRNSPAVLGGEGKKGGGAGAGVDNSGNKAPGLVKGYSNQDLAQLTNATAGFVDGLADQFSNFNIDSAAFGADSGAFGAYGSHDVGAFAYDGSAGYGAMGGANRFAGLRLEDLQGDMLPLCKDQFGCRYLQKKLEDGNPEHRDMIFNEIFPHFAELMTDPFANYLSQRLLEYSTDEQRDALIESISGELVSISLNMHGTRAVQKMIDYLSTQRQVQSLILALNLNVVTLIKDLNGNHVIQKCLNHLPPEDNQFIYNAVATHCIEVATHRHGCCVLQRCIDHASESQRIQLVTEITYNSLTLVQDAFGNYVVQYVLDLNDNRFIEAIVRQFLGNVSALSAQKFSSNVVEKCIRVADATGRRAIIDELLNKQRLERLLRDSFANYVVQTALDYAEPSQRAQLIETIRPILPMIRNTPYGKRIQSKIQRETHDHHMRGGYHHHMVPNGHYYGMNSMHPPPHYMGHPGHHMGGPQMGGEFGSRGPYMGGYGNQGPPPPPPHMQHHQNPNMPGSGPHQFAPFPMQSMGGLGEYPVNGGMTGMSGMSSHVGLSNGGYGGFM